MLTKRRQDSELGNGLADFRSNGGGISPFAITVNFLPPPPRPIHCMQITYAVCEARHRSSEARQQTSGKGSNGCFECIRSIESFGLRAVFPCGATPRPCFAIKDQGDLHVARQLSPRRVPPLAWTMQQLRQ